MDSFFTPPANAEMGFDEQSEYAPKPVDDDAPANTIPIAPKKPKLAKVKVEMQDENEVDLEQFSFYDGRALEVDWTGNTYANVKWISEQDNLTPYMSEGSRVYMGRELLRLMSEDDATRHKWKQAAELGMRLCDDLDENVLNDQGEIQETAPRFPMLVQAVTEFAGKAQQTLLAENVLAKCEIKGDESPEAVALGEKASVALSATVRNGNWEDDTDRMLHVLGTQGTTFRKWCYDEGKGEYYSEFLTGYDIIVNNNVDSLESAPRIFQPFTLYPHEAKRNIGTKRFSEFPIELEDLVTNPHKPIKFVEAHLWMDLDGDGQDEPYIVTIHVASQKTVRVEAAFDELGFTVTEKGVNYRKLQYYQDYHLVRSFDGTFYSYGFGKLIGKLNENANRMIQSILDSAERHNANTGIMSSMGVNVEDSIKLEADEIALVETEGSTLRENLVMLPTKEPSSVLFSVLGLLMEKSDRLAATTDLMGEGAASMTATTAMAVVNQGTAAHSAIHKRLWRSMGGEFNILFDLLRENQTGTVAYRDGKAKAVIDLADLPMDVDVRVTADPAMTSEMHRAAQAQYYQGFMEDPGTNQEELKLRMHTLMKVPEPEKLIAPPPQGPDPQQIMAEKELELKLMEQRRKATETSIKAKLTGAQVSKLLAEAVSTITPEDSKQDLGRILQEAQKLLGEITGAEIDQSNEQQNALIIGGSEQPTPPPPNGPPEIPIAPQIEGQAPNLLGGPGGQPGGGEGGGIENPLGPLE